MFFECGFDVRARPEAGVRGEDFDFQAVRDGETINVEVAAWTSSAFSIQTVENALHRKRKQLPDTNPAMIFCVLPESWFATPMEFSWGHLPKGSFRRRDGYQQLCM
jgi:hypothetical protein